ncbi:hypothetical protein ACTNCI_09550, partial [Mitsuokella jalaludinii]|uniref:hypothetical protein n=1 Tax=Mitsuokella jalaludinii TaxID=187979 RepID=UPI003F8A3070
LLWCFGLATLLYIAKEAMRFYYASKVVKCWKQIYYLTKIHVGAKQNTRLPITTKYADLICKNLEYMPKNQFLYKLYFL